MSLGETQDLWVLSFSDDIYNHKCLATRFFKASKEVRISKYRLSAKVVLLSKVFWCGYEIFGLICACGQ